MKSDCHKNEAEALLKKQAEWQKSRRMLSWPEKVRQAEKIRESIVKLRQS